MSEPGPIGRMIHGHRARRNERQRATPGRVERVERCGYGLSDPAEVARLVAWDAVGDDDAGLDAEVRRVLRANPSLTNLAGGGDAGEGRRDRPRVPERRSVRDLIERTREEW